MYIIVFFIFSLWVLVVGGIVAGVVLEDFVAQAGSVDMNIDFGSGNALVAQHLLDGSQVGAALEQVGGETVAQGVGTDDLAHSCQFAQLFDDVENHLAREHGSASVQEEDVLAASLHNLVGTRLLQIQIDLFDGDRRNRDYALFVALTLNDHVALLDKQL